MTTFRTATSFMLAASLYLVSCKKENDEPQNVSGGTQSETNDDVFELAIRRLNPGQNVADFEAARDAFVAELMARPGTSNDREFQPSFDLLASGLPLDSIYIGMTQYADLNTFSTLSQQLIALPEAATFFGTFAPITFEVMQPLPGYGPIDLSTVAPLSSGRILEIAVRDISAYSNFDTTDYMTKRDSFLALLAQQPGFVQEIQWRSLLNNNVVVGMTVYDSQAAALAIGMDANFMGSPAVTEFLGAYPPTQFGALNTVLK